jgi:hypothetical protein
MAKFSDAFLQGLRGSGQRGSPTDPALQRADQYGSSNPLAKSIGGMFGMQMDTGQELASKELRQIDQKSPDALIQALGVQSKYEQDPQKKVLYMAEIAKIQKAKALSSSTQTASIANRDSVASIVRGKYPKLAEAIINEQGSDRTDALKAGLKIVEEQGSKEGTKGKAQFDAWESYMDTEGNFFNVGVRSDPATQTSSRVIVPVGDALEPVGALSLSSIAEKGSQQEAKEFGILRVQSARELPELKTAYEGIGRALELVNSIETGGPINTAGTALESFIGTKSADKQELEVLLGEAMYQRLKPLFGGVISEGERAAVEKMYGSLSKGNAANTGVLRYMQRLTEKSYTIANLVRTSSNFNEYNVLLNKLYPEDLNTGEEEKQVADDVQFYLDQADQADQARKDATGGK